MTQFDASQIPLPSFKLWDQVEGADGKGWGQIIGLYWANPEQLDDGITQWHYHVRSGEFPILAKQPRKFDLWDKIVSQEGFIGHVSGFYYDQLDGWRYYVWGDGDTVVLCEEYELREST